MKTNMEMINKPRDRFKIPDNVVRRIVNLVKTAKKGIKSDTFPIIYYLNYRDELDFQRYGYQTLEDFFIAINSNELKFQEENDGIRIIYSPAHESACNSPNQIDSPESNLEFIKNICQKFKVMNVKELFKVGQKIRINVTQVYTPSKFYVMVTEFEPALNKLNNELQEYYNKNKKSCEIPNNFLQNNLVCVALYTLSNGRKVWNRSIITEAENHNVVDVTFVDYGTLSSVLRNDLRLLRSDFLDLPAQAFLVKLDNIKPVSWNDWCDLACNRFLELVSVSSTELLVTAIDQKNSVISGILYYVKDGTSININELLIAEGWALPVHSVETSAQGLQCSSSEEVNPLKLKKKSSESSCNTCEANRTIYYEEREKNINYLAFNILKRNETIRSLARENYDAALKKAEELAWKIVR